MEQHESTISYREVRELGSDQLMMLAMDYYYGDNTGKKAQSEYDSHFDIPDEVIYEHYSGIEFVPEDFGGYDWDE